MENEKSKFDHIKGWAVDADSRNEPTYPMKKYTGDDHQRLNYTRPYQQPRNVEVLHSNERPGLTAVFGTSVPPSGLSGKVRRYAFNYSEGSFGHWLPLLLADRINVAEGIIDDFRKGVIPNILSEKGWKAEWKYNRKGLVQKVLVTAAVTVVVIGLLRKGNANG
ncbi:hypothetical protein EDD80_103312 [Anseongella ginsenosidimutans]|uniref:Uncharacterized protein n=1 Tax=Anseongella ginsenosidimutans TaxID=496056 RepID=A0A4R3KTU1_9SPHI|nr:hypothetical protein [Anseongella ginsenosidimutans]QEC53543.1 hypothetical protein FRZ59_15175 [Anseongella ginsenosidimutans]TCS88447.1 hypothetical protein EDD80_103312 [Anseongella ginsenosidimutans]